MSYDEPQMQAPAFIGRSSENRAAALDKAAEEAQRFFKEQGREGKVVLEVIREEITVSNPHISEFRIIVVESGGGGDGG